MKSEFSAEEIEYEKNKVVVDEIEKESEFLKVGLKKNLFLNTYLSVEQALIYNGKYEEFHLNMPVKKNNRKYSLTSYQEPTISLAHWFEHNMRENYFHSLYATYRPKFYRPKIIEFGNGRHQVRLGYNFLHVFKKYWVEGDIYTELFGRKKLILTDTSIEVTPAYTEFGVNFKLGYFKEKWRSFLQLGFGQTTNYSSKSDFIERDSDKGFVTNIGLGYNYSFAPSWNIDFRGEAITKVFNAKEEDHSAEVDFEYEAVNASLSLRRLF
ncbi:phenol degradation protein [Bacteriovorax sp. Seq25_V]|uniref:phenol degradation protein n=1 Tax=Bacteriovorax sp. Seq25_V TaxID=1201288 RepID=UPI00038A0BD3|nr:phenol degradation protein [Bacteriovorax sp. Seq25_V]EQC46264.1 MetA-pathway of phenol degradation domain protein [Bacteriovorax sp. Seq25_V]